MRHPVLFFFSQRSFGSRYRVKREAFISPTVAASCNSCPLATWLLCCSHRTTGAVLRGWAFLCWCLYVCLLVSRWPSSLHAKDNDLFYFSFFFFFASSIFTTMEFTVESTQENIACCSHFSFFDEFCYFFSFFFFYSFELQWWWNNLQRNITDFLDILYNMWLCIA